MRHGGSPMIDSRARTALNEQGPPYRIIYLVSSLGVGRFGYAPQPSLAFECCRAFALIARAPMRPSHKGVKGAVRQVCAADLRLPAPFDEMIPPCGPKLNGAKEEA